MEQGNNPLLWPYCKTCDTWFPDHRDLKFCTQCNTEFQFEEPPIDDWEEEVECTVCNDCGETYFYNYGTCPNCNGELTILNTLE